MNDKQHNINITLPLCLVSLCWVSHFIYYYAEFQNADCRYAECCCAECRYAECHCAECRSALSKQIHELVKIININFLYFILIG